MIYIARGIEPKGFASFATRCKREFEDLSERNPALTTSAFWNRVRKRQVLSRFSKLLHDALHNKCAYCESKVKHVAAIHVEHFRPKANNKFPELMFVWKNWLIACPKCNSHKGTKFPFCGKQPCFIDPATENPNKHIDFFKAEILSKTKRGKITIDEIVLDRIPLNEERTRWLNKINLLLLLALDGLDEARKHLIWSMQPDAPFSAMIRAYLERISPKLAKPDNPHPFIEERNQTSQIAKLIEQNLERLQELI